MGMEDGYWPRSEPYAPAGYDPNVSVRDSEDVVSLYSDLLALRRPGEG